MAAKYTIILAKNSTQGNQYARRIGLPRASYRAVNSASQIKGIRRADVHILPDFYKRPDRHAILAQIKFLRGRRDAQVIDVEMPNAPVVDQGDGMGPQLTIDDLLAGGAEPEPAPRKRRSRCKECGELTLEKHDHKPEIVVNITKPAPTDAIGLF